MLTGALASSYYGEPRTTMDIDVVLRLPRKDLSRLLASLAKAGLAVETERVDTALKAGFRILTFEDTKTPHNVDIILSERKLRRRRGSILGMPTYYQTPEELILTKLHMVKATVDPGRAAKDKQDIRSIIHFTKVKLEAVKRSAEKETTLELLRELLR